MAKRTWSKDAARERIQSRLAEVDTVQVRDYVRDTNLADLGNGVAYRVDGVHFYADILNIDEMLGVTDFEGPTCHKRTLRFLNLHYRAVRNLLLEVDAIQVDFHNQRLHAVFAKPYGDEAARVHRAIATAKLIMDLLARTGEAGDDPLPAAKVRVGIDTGEALAVNNGRRGHREPLFLGEPANRAAKRAGGGFQTGIYLTNTARAAVGWAAVADENATMLTGLQIKTSEENAKLGISVDDLYKWWCDDLANNPIGKFEFSAHTPPFKDLDIETLTERNSRRQEAVSVYADIDGFTDYVSARIDDDELAKDVVRVLHVLRAELDGVLHEDFAGRKIRFIGDCVHGVMVEGTASTTAGEETAKNAILCAGAMRSSFELALEVLEEEGIDIGALGLAIGIEYGPLAITRLGVKGERIRCCVSRSVLQSEKEQLECNGTQTKIGVYAYKHAPTALRGLFGTVRRKSNLRYQDVVDALEKAETASKSATASNGPLLRPATSATAAGFTFTNKPTGPKTPAGFA